LKRGKEAPKRLWRDFQEALERPIRGIEEGSLEAIEAPRGYTERPQRIYREATEDTERLFNSSV
jgi:hypothetical protein